MRPFLERSIGPVPDALRLWAEHYIEPSYALTCAEEPELRWLASHAIAIARTRPGGLGPEPSALYPGTTTRLSPSAMSSLRRTIAATAWWSRLRIQWDHEQTRGLGTVAYTIGHGRGAAIVRGTRVGRFAVRELRMPRYLGFCLPDLRHMETTPDYWANWVGPEFLYAIDLPMTGQSVGCYVSPAVAFEIAIRFDRADVLDAPIPPKLQRLLDVLHGPPPPTSEPTWPAPPPANFVARNIEMRPPMLEVHHAAS